MSSIILRSATRYLFPILMLFSIFLLLRGHNEPGGGFIGGLLGATSFALYALAYDVPHARNMLRVDPHVLLGVGLLMAAGSGLFAMVLGEPYLTAQWWEWTVPVLGEVKINTPLIFDIGVYLTVVSVVLMIIFALAEE